MRKHLDGSGRGDRVAAGITFFVMLAIGVSWVTRGFFRVSIGWQLGLGIPLLIILVDNAAGMLGRKGSLLVFRRRKHR